MYCSLKTRRFNKDFIMINETKTEYCYHLYDKMLEFDIDRFTNYLK